MGELYIKYFFTLDTSLNSLYNKSPYNISHLKDYTTSEYYPMSRGGSTTATSTTMSPKPSHDDKDAEDGNENLDEGKVLPPPSNNNNNDGAKLANANSTVGGHTTATSNSNNEVGAKRRKPLKTNRVTQQHMQVNIYKSKLGKS